MPDLLKRYKKYHPEEKVLPATVQIEMELMQLLQQGQETPPAYTIQVPQPSTFTTSVDIVFTHPPADLFSLHPQGDSYIHHQAPLSASQSHALLARLQDVVAQQVVTEHLEKPDDWQAQLSRVVMARIYFESGRYKKALESLERLALRFEDVNWGYGLVLLIQARVIKGISLEMENRIPEALEAYDAAWEVMDSHFNEKNDHLAHWMEEALYRAILLRVYQNAPVKQTLKSMRCYHALAMRHWPSNFRVTRRWPIYNLYTQYLIKTYQDDTYVAMTITAPNESMVSLAPSTSGPTSYQQTTNIADELTEVLQHFRQLFLAMEPTLPRETINQQLLDLLQLTFLAHDIIGWGDLANLRRIQRFLYHAKAKTFNNASVTRLLFFTLVRLGDFNEAKFALRSYMEMVGLPESDNPDAHANLEVEDKVALIQRKLKIRATLAANTSAILQESEASIIQVLHVAVLMYGREFLSGQVASQLADVALTLARESEQVHIPLLAECYRLKGTAYGFWATQCEAAELRSELHGEALHALGKCVDLDASWQGYYELALQQATMRDLTHAMASVAEALKRHPDHLPSWHLLALLSSSKQIHQYPKALQVLEAGLKQVDLHSLNMASAVGSVPMVAGLPGQYALAQAFDQAEAYLSARMTQLELLETLEGPEAVLATYNDLFTTYGKLSQQLGLVHGELTHASDASDEKSSKRSIDSLAVGYAPNRTHSTGSLRSRSNSVNQHSSSPLANSTSQASLAPTPKPSQSEEIPSQRLPSVDRLHHQQPTASAQPLSSSKSIKEKKKRGLIDMRLGRRIHSVTSTQDKPTRSDSQSTSSASSSSKPKLSTNVSLASMVAPSFSSLTTLGRRDSESSTVWSTLQPQPAKTEVAFVRHQRERWDALMVKIWVMCTSSFIKAGRFEQAIQAIMEAEEIGLTDANVWHMLGVLCWSAYTKAIERQQLDDNQGANEENPEDLYDTSMEAFKKALAIDPDHIATHIDMASAWIQHQPEPEWELAETLLERITKSLGWDRHDAWYYLGCAFQQQKDMARAKDCFLYAMDLSETHPVRPFTVLPRFI
ncbi:hypothetical protein DM01DRAFT_1340288 [Hesseltinella vesiculosa]|uniref:TPR-like protein n=1 Tax=Hesseltinella vesiculosa TaxID=101127 RepID=A0A1X2G4F8_9FUNG|nr:hypothetical protein DM01DRAFT_1340288 [Hesseltinella vesiculosa]